MFNRSQRNGIFLLVLIIISLQAFYFFGSFSSQSSAPETEDPELVLFQEKIDSLRQVSKTGDTLKIFPFNPNFITDYRGYVLGMSVEEIDKIIAYRAADNWANSAAEFQQVTGISDSLLEKIEPYFRFPEWVTREPSSVKLNTRQPTPQIAYEDKQDLNSATVEELQEIKGIGEVLSGRIVNYKNKIGGYVDDLQLKDIYGLNYEVRDEVLARFTVKDAPEQEILDINAASVLELSEVPYFNYELAREIVNYRLLHEKISTFEELANIKDFPSEKIDRIALYLTLK